MIIWKIYQWVNKFMDRIENVIQIRVRYSETGRQERKHYDNNKKCLQLSTGNMFLRE